MKRKTISLLLAAILLLLLASCGSPAPAAAQSASPVGEATEEPAAATAAEGSASVPQDHCRNAIMTTGAGDTFNGGYMVASAAGLPLRARLMVSNAATRYDVEHAAPPTMEQLIRQIEKSGT